MSSCHECLHTTKNENVAALSIARNGIRGYKSIFEADTISPTDLPQLIEMILLEDVPVHFGNEMEHFFSVYKDLEMATVEVKGWAGREEAYAEIERSVERYWEHMQGRK